MKPDALHAAVGHLCREWGDYGYRVLELRSIGWRGAGAIHVRCSDGSEFWIACDQYGGHLVDADTFDNVLVRVGEAINRAAAGIGES